MIDLYTWSTPNGRKVSILLEELGLDYEVHPIDISGETQHEDWYRAIAPNGKIPSIRVRDTGMTMMESGAICLWLSDREKRFDGGDHRWEVVEWAMWQMGQLGPYFGAAHQFLHYNRDKAGEFGIARSHRQVGEVYGVLDKRLTGRDYIAGAGTGDYTVVDMMCWPWVAQFRRHEADLNAYPAVRDWYLRIAERPAVVRGFNVPVEGEIAMP